MSKKLLSTLIASLFVSPAFGAAPEPFIAEGAATLGVVNVSTSGTDDPSKLREYQDLGNGAVSNVLLRGRGGNVWFDALGENFGRDDQYISFRGGMYDAFKYRLYSDSMRHEFLIGGRTPFAGSGSSTLTATFPAADPGLWNKVDVGYKRSDNGGYFEWQGLAPLYLRVDANEVKFEGTKIGAASNGTSPGNGFVDLALPVQYATRNATAEIGYNTGTLNLSASWLMSKFTDGNDVVRWSNPFWANGLDATYLAPDNKYNRLALNGTLRSLPMGSTFAARYTWAELKSDAPLAALALNGTGTTAYGATNPNVGAFNGKHKDQTLNLTLASQPVRALDTRAYYNFYDRKNQSTLVEYAAVAGLNCSSAPCDNELFEYTKHNLGLEGTYRINRSNRVSAGYDYWKKEYEGRPEYSGSKENKLFVGVKSTQIPNVSARAKYTYTERRSDFLWGHEGNTGADAAYLERFVSAYDLSNVNKEELKLGADFSPMPMLDVSLEAILKQNKYRGVTFGRTKDTRSELYASASWGDFEKLRVTLFGDWEVVKYDAAHRYIGAVPCSAASGLLCNDPSQPPTALAYNWTSKVKDRNWVLGAGADLRINEQFLIKGSVLYVETNGSADFSTQCGGAPGGGSTTCPGTYIAPFAIGNFDDSKRTSFNLKGIYSLNSNWSFTLGYAFEKWRYNDISHDGQTYTIPYPGVTNSTSQSYLNGYLANPNFEANIVYLLATFKF